jgi:sugar phosphate isomerase/epimerase
MSGETGGHGAGRADAQWERSPSAPGAASCPPWTDREAEHMVDAAPLVVSSYTLGTEVGFVDRVRAAAGAGFDGIGLRAENYRAAGLGDAAMLAVAEQHGVRILEVEYLTGWGTPADRDEAQQEKERTVFHMARAFGVRHLNAGLLEGLPLDVMTEAFAALCVRAGPELTVALEFMPYSGVPDLTTAWRIVQGVPNGSLIVDNWHWARAGQKPADLDEVPAERIVSVQLCDVRAEPMEPLRAESLGHRLPPGQGYGDTIGLVQALSDHGVTPAVMAVEVISDELVARGVEIAARVTADAAREVLARCGYRVAGFPEADC